MTVWTKIHHYWRLPAFWVAIFSCVALCYFAGPFGTIDTLPPALRFIYWGLIVVITGLMGASVLAIIEDISPPNWLGLSLVVAGFGLAVSVVVVLVSTALLPPTNHSINVGRLVFYSWPSASGIFAFLYFLRKSGAGRSNSYGIGTNSIARPALLKRLKNADDKTEIWALTAQDHYVDVKTNAGSELCLIRLSDAIKEVAPVEGMKVHRSHWVALHAVAEIQTLGRRHVVRLKDDTVIPISTSNMKAIREWRVKGAAASARI